MRIKMNQQYPSKHDDTIEVVEGNNLFLRKIGWEISLFSKL